ncbi:hypothetical protein [Desulfogranum japonicum]|uniref:hypothetical protein n=1 Tax=Desulfogranum japonicum TaxID=231447 RepID=UPI00129477E3|nr:hypothetical protein [Desulfogranum japonicum]
MNIQINLASGSDQKPYYDEAYNIYKTKPYDNDILAHYIEIPKTWTIDRVSDKSKELTTALKPLGLYSHVGEVANTLSQIQVAAVALDSDVTPLKFIQFYLNQISKINKIHIHTITTIDDYHAMASLDWEVQETPFHGELFITISNDRNRVFIVQGMTNEKSKEEWTKQCNYIFHSFQIINNEDA